MNYELASLNLLKNVQLWKEEKKKKKKKRKEKERERDKQR